MKTALIFINGNLSDTSSAKQWLQQTDIVICADGGVRHALREGITPSVVVGDLDSITPQAKTVLTEKQVSFITYPREKDATDAELAIQYAIEQGAKRLVIAGMLGDRIDHFMANILYLAELSQTVDLLILEKEQEIQFVYDHITVAGHPGDELSLLPVKADCQGVTTQGLYYELKNDALPLGSTRGISNVFVQKEVRVSLIKGVLLVIHRQLS